MAKLYAITTGNYSAYRILSLCSDRESAEKLKARIVKEAEGYPDECRIEEYDDGKVYTDESLKGWFLSFDRNGKVEDVEQDNFENGLSVEPYGWFDDEKKNIIKVFVYVLATDEQSAIKIAAEKRAVYLAQKEGIQKSSHEKAETLVSGGLFLFNVYCISTSRREVFSRLRRSSVQGSRHTSATSPMRRSRWLRFQAARRFSAARSCGSLAGCCPVSVQGRD